MSSQLRSLITLALCILLCLGVGMAGAVFTHVSVNTWYPSLIKPPGTPPSFVFAPIWIILYLLMGIALWLAKKSHASKQAYALFYTQLLLNLFWSFFFFGMQRIPLGMIDIVLLDITLMGTIATFWQSSRTAALLLVPYLLWILYATYLNTALLMLN